MPLPCTTAFLVIFLYGNRSAFKTFGCFGAKGRKIGKSKRPSQEREQKKTLFKGPSFQFREPQGQPQQFHPAQQGREPPDKGQKELYSFYKRMGRERQNLFTFLFIGGVPPDSNGSERAVRNIKVKQKISGQFKLGTSAQNFTQIRSVIDMTIKNGLNVLDALSLIAKLETK